MASSDSTSDNAAVSMAAGTMKWITSKLNPNQKPHEQSSFDTIKASNIGNLIQRIESEKFDDERQKSLNSKSSGGAGSTDRISKSTAGSHEKEIDDEGMPTPSPTPMSPSPDTTSPR